VFDECRYDVEPILITVRKQQFRQDELILIQTIVVLVVESPPKIQLGGHVLTQRLVTEVVLQIPTKFTGRGKLFRPDDLLQVFINPLNRSFLVDRTMLVVDANAAGGDRNCN
jgi:hypothetical protein